MYTTITFNPFKPLREQLYVHARPRFSGTVQSQFSANSQKLTDISQLSNYSPKGLNQTTEVIGVLDNGWPESWNKDKANKEDQTSTETTAIS